MPRPDGRAAERMRIAAIIPVANLEGAKTRLGETLDAEERHDLVTGLLARTVVTALAVAGLDDVLVVSPDREVLTRAAELGARTLRQRSRGLNAGLREGRDDATAGGADAILVLPIDLPFVSDEAIAAVLAPLPDAPRTADAGTDRRPRHRPPRDGHQRPGAAAARRDRPRLRAGQPRTPIATGPRPPAPGTSRSPTRR